MFDALEGALTVLEQLAPAETKIRQRRQRRFGLPRARRAAGIPGIDKRQRRPPRMAHQYLVVGLR